MVDKLLDTQLREDTMLYWLTSQHMMKGCVMPLTMLGILKEIRQHTNPARKLIQHTLRLRAAIIETAEQPIEDLKAELEVPTSLVVDAQHRFNRNNARKEAAA